MTRGLLIALVVGLLCAGCGSWLCYGMAKGQGWSGGDAFVWCYIPPRFVEVEEGRMRLASDVLRDRPEGVILNAHAC